MMIQGVKHMTDFEAKKAILDIGKRMYDKGFVASMMGISAAKWEQMPFGLRRLVSQKVL